MMIIVIFILLTIQMAFISGKKKKNEIPKVVKDPQDFTHFFFILLF